jgi:SAM-dependent methyltransferase
MNKKEVIDRNLNQYTRMTGITSQIDIDNQAKSHKDLLDMLPGGENKKALDVGCGLGGSRKELLDKGYAWQGLDAIQSTADSQDFVECGFQEDLEELYSPNYFDLVWCRHCLEHSYDIIKTLDGIKTILKDDGYFAFFVPQGIHDEPAHIFQTDKLGWINVIESRFEIINSGVHDFNLNEFYGIARKK